jgi:hypothetical protein
MSYADPTKARDALRRWRENNPDKQKAINARAAPREKAYRQSHKTEAAEWQRQWRADNPKDVMIINARVRAKQRSILCTIAVESLEWPTHCPIFGIELDYNATPTGQRKHAPREAFPSLDRRDPTIGYVPGNVFVISYKANRLKQDASIGQLEALLAYMKS